MQIEATDPKSTPPRTVQFECNFGDTLAEMVSLLGEEKVFNLAQAKAEIGAQASARTMIRAGKTDEEIAAKMIEYKPGLVQRNASSGITKNALKSLLSLPEAELLAKIAELRAKQAELDAKATAAAAAVE